MTPALSDETVVVRPFWARLQHCHVRNTWLFLVPERVLFPCPITVEILQRIETPHSIGEIARDLAREYDASEREISADIVQLLGDFMEKGYVRRVAV